MAGKNETNLVLAECQRRFYVHEGRLMRLVNGVGKMIGLGQFSEKEDAIAVRRKAEIEIFGSYAGVLSRSHGEDISHAVRLAL